MINKEKTIQKFLDAIRVKLECVDFHTLTDPIKFSMVIDPKVTVIDDEDEEVIDIKNGTSPLFSVSDMEFIGELESKYKLNRPKKDPM